MGKRKQTLARPPQRMTKRERTKWQRERRIQRNLIIVFVAIGLVSVLVLAYAVYSELVIEPNQVVAQVNGEPIHLREYWAARRNQLVNDWWGQTSQIQDFYMQNAAVTLTEELKSQLDGLQLGLRNTLLSLSRVRRDPVEDTVVQQLIQDAILTQGARDMGIQVSDADVDAWLFPETQQSPSAFESLPTQTQSLTSTVATPTPLSTLSPQEQEEQLVDRLTGFYDQLRQDMKDAAAGNLGFSRDDYVAMFRQSIRMTVLQQRVQEKLKEGLPKEEEQVQAFHILIQERMGLALQARQALLTGTSFGKVAVQYSDDAATRDRAGELPPVVRGSGQPTPQMEEAALTITDVLGYGRPFTDANGAHLLQLLQEDPAGEWVRVRQILFAVSPQTAANTVLSLLKGGKLFEDVAKAYSEDEASASQGGELGWLTQGEGKPSAEVEAAAFALSVTNPLSPVVSDTAGLHILQLVQPGAFSQTVSGQPQVHVRQIVIRSGARAALAQAQEVLDKLNAGTLDFPQAVAQYSADATSLAQVGDLGWVTQGDGTLSPAVDSAAFALTLTNSVSSVVTDTQGYHVLQLAEPVTRTADGRSRAHLRQIVVKYAKDLTQEIYDFITAGSPDELSTRFAKMAMKYSDDQQSKASGGDLGWFGRGSYPEFGDQAFDPAAVGQVLKFEGGSGWHILWVRDHQQSRPVDEQTLEARASQAYDDWLKQLTDKATVERFPPPTVVPTAVPPTAAPPTPIPTFLAPSVPISGTATP